MTYSFRVGVLDMPLFDPAIWVGPHPGRGRGRKEALKRRELLRGARREVVTITLDDDAAGALEHYLELDSDGLALDLERYTHVGYRPKARGMGGGRLGDAGELLTFLAHRTAVGSSLHERLLRVVECRNWATDQAAPMPDFLVAGGKVLEIKTREFLDFHDIANAVAPSPPIAGCNGFVDARWEGLAQLGYDDGVNLTRATHSLRTANGVFVPFPASAGVLDLVLVRDHRVLALRGQANLPVTHRDCTSAAHDCWSCAEQQGVPLDALVIEMHNDPDALPLEDLESHDDWRRRYGAWSRALWSRSQAQTDGAAAALMSSVLEWAQPMERARQRWIREFWRRYLGMAAWERGLRAPGLQIDGDGAAREPTAAPASIGELPELISSAMDEGREGRWSIPAHGTEYVVLVDPSVVRVRTLVPGWAEGEVVEGNARWAVNRLLRAAFGEPLPEPEDTPIALRPIQIGVRDEGVLIAWRPARAQEGGGWKRGVLESWHRPWVTRLRMGDPRASLVAFRDGRLEYTIRRARG